MIFSTEYGNPFADKVAQEVHQFCILRKIKEQVCRFRTRNARSVI